MTINLFAFLICSGCAAGCLKYGSPLGFLACLVGAAVNLCFLAYRQGWIQ